MTQPKRDNNAAWRKIRRQVLYEAQQAGLWRCPLCGIPLNYAKGKEPASAEVDHIKPWSHGGTDDRQNLRVICRRDNQSRGNRDQPTIKQFHTPIRNSGRWG